MEFVDLRNIAIPDHVLELIPESVCRENCVIAYAAKNGALYVAVLNGDEDSRDTLEKLCFILNREIRCAWSWRDDILAAIDRHYRQSK